MNRIARTTFAVIVLAGTACADITAPVPTASEPLSSLMVIDDAVSLDSTGNAMALTAEADDPAEDVVDALDRIAHSFATPRSGQLQSALRRLAQDIREQHTGPAKQALRMADEALTALEAENDPDIAADLGAIRLVLERR